jgi:ElaB/YqjD/DUF883 family membrane-anchored ribosome-binding protein
MSYEKQVAHLMDSARELVSKLRDTDNPDVRRLRDRVDTYVSGAHRQRAQRMQGPVKITRIPGSLLEYVHDHPWLAVLTAASLAWTLGHLSSAVREKAPTA